MKSLISKFFGGGFSKFARSEMTANSAIVSQALEDPWFPVLVSFPRTGSHWLRMMMELYFDRPTLVRAFYFLQSRDYLAFHTHDLDLKTQRKSVIYLYRDPVDTVYSQLKYHGRSLDDAEAMQQWCVLYGKHLSKWMIGDCYSERKTIITYERLRNSLWEEFGCVVEHFGKELDKQKLASVANQVTRDEVKDRTRHDPQVISRERTYSESREEFRNSYGAKVLDLVLAQDKGLGRYIG